MAIFSTAKGPGPDDRISFKFRLSSTSIFSADPPLPTIPHCVNMLFCSHRRGIGGVFGEWHTLPRAFIVHCPTGPLSAQCTSEFFRSDHKCCNPTHALRLNLKISFFPLECQISTHGTARSRSHRVHPGRCREVARAGGRGRDAATGPFDFHRLLAGRATRSSARRFLRIIAGRRTRGQPMTQPNG